MLDDAVSTRSHAKAAGHAKRAGCADNTGVSTRSHAKAAGFVVGDLQNGKIVFQLAATRRRLVLNPYRRLPGVCFNSQPREGGWPLSAWAAVCKTLFQLAATRRRLDQAQRQHADAFCFNSQPREGGWDKATLDALTQRVFQLAATRRRLGFMK